MTMEMPFDLPHLRKQRSQLLALARGTLFPALAAMDTISERQRALIESLDRVDLWMKSLELLDDPIHHQAVAAGARALFELALDCQTLATDQSGLELQKYEAFPEVEHFRASEKLISFYDRTPGRTLHDLAERKRYVDERGRRDKIHETCRRLWGRDPAKERGAGRGWPQQWSDKGSEQRARECGPDLEELHALAYPTLSWFIHPGAAGLSTGPENREAILGLSTAIAVQSLLTAMATVVKEMKLSDVERELASWAKSWKPDLLPTP